MPASTETFSSIFADNIASHLSTIEALRQQATLIETISQKIISALQSGNKIIFFGNGGSAADAQHLAAEFVVRYRHNRRALPSIALTTDTSILTACGNDFGFDQVYARQIQALANAGDIAIGISTSGNSENVINGLEAASTIGCTTIAFTAQDGGTCAKVADLSFRAPSPITARAQECHLFIGHILCEMVEAWVAA